MTVETLTLTEFLLARIAEDEVTARTALVVDGRQVWQVQDWIELDNEVLAHTDRHDPHRVLAECEAKRRIVNIVPDLQGVLGALALPYANHPDFREEWRP